MRKASFLLPLVFLLGLQAALPAKAFIPYSRSLIDMMLPADDPFRILEQTPLTIPKGVDTLNLARADWKETSHSHVISVDVPGVRKGDVKIEVEESRLLRISGERKGEEEVEGEKWHRVERTSGKFWRQFRLPATADMDAIKAHLENGVLRVTIPKRAEEKRQPKVVNILEEESNSKGEDIKASKAEM